MKSLGKTLLLAALGWAAAAHASFGPGEVVIVLNSGEGSISIVDPVAKKEVKRVPVGKEPHHLMATPDNKELIVANASSNDLVFLDPKTGDILRRVPDISDPYQIGYSPDKKWFVSASNRLDRVRMKNNALAFHHLSDIFDRKDDARFIVGIHDADDGRIIAQRVLQFIEVKPSPSVHRKFRNPVSIFLQMTTELQHRVVFHLGGNQMTFFRMRGKRSMDGGIIAFGAATGKNYFFRIGAEQTRNLLPGIDQVLFHVRAEMVHA